MFNLFVFFVIIKVGCGYMNNRKLKNDELILNYKNGDMLAKDELIAINIKLIHFLARKYLNDIRNTIIDYDDLISEGIIGLLKAIDKFDITRSVSFNSYMYKAIDYSIQRSISINRNPNKKPIYLQEKRRAFYYERNCLENKLGRICTRKEIMKLFNIDEYAYLAIFNDELSLRLDQKLSKENSHDLSFLIPSDETLEDDVINKLELEEIRNLVESTILTKREQNVIKYRYGFNGIILTGKQIAGIMGVSYSYINFVENTALKKIKNILLEKQIENNKQYKLL